MEAYILIVMIVGKDAGLSAEFNSLEACEYAEQRLEEVHKGRNRQSIYFAETGIFCVPKG